MIAEISREIVGREIEAAHMLVAFHDGFAIESDVYPELFVLAKSTRRDAIFRLRFDVSNYDEEPPQVRVVDADGNEVASSKFPLLNNGAFPNHNLAGLPHFLCLQGVRDYYTHENHLPSKTGLGWEQHRRLFPLSVVLKTISDKFRNGDWH